MVSAPAMIAIQFYQSKLCKYVLFAYLPCLDTVFNFFTSYKNIYLFIYILYIVLAKTKAWLCILLWLISLLISLYYTNNKAFRTHALFHKFLRERNTSFKIALFSTIIQWNKTLRRHWPWVQLCIYTFSKYISTVTRILKNNEVQCCPPIKYMIIELCKIN